MRLMTQREILPSELGALTTTWRRRCMFSAKQLRRILQAMGVFVMRPRNAAPLSTPPQSAMRDA